ncbi:MAG: hypothetical protein KME57_36280 [Scytonema hyalinum WJT4-NPBG1]|jgi:hypothetical protein|nr:hypothetical protein [Scytonema hyalinum WJT4-NPBG1]
MYFINDVASELSLSIDEIRMILMDVRPDWESCDRINDAEYVLIKQSAQAALPSGNTSITPVSPEQMPLDQQEQLVNNASQVLGFPLAIAVLQEIRMVEALQTAKNHAVLSVIRAKREELNQELDKQAETDEQGFIAIIQQITNSIPATAFVTTQKMQKQADTANSQIAALLKDIEARSLGKAQ